MRMTEQERRIRIRHLKRMYRIRERKERHDKKVSGLFMKRVVFTLILPLLICGLIVYTELEEHCPELMGDMTDRNTEEFDKEENK